MLDVVTAIRPITVSRLGDPAPEVCVWDHVARLVAWLDAANGSDRHQIATRIMKITEQAGAAVAAYLALTGNIQHAGVRVTADELAGELCDVALAALVALTTVTGGTPQAEARLTAHVARSAHLAAPRGRTA